MLALLLASFVTAEPFDCSAHGIESLNHLFTVSTVSQSSSQSWNRTVYVNPCGPIEGVPICGDDNRYCVVTEFESNSEAQRTEVLKLGSPSVGSVQGFITFDNTLWTCFGTNVGGKAISTQMNFVVDASGSPAVDCMGDERFMNFQLETPLVNGLQGDEFTEEHWCPQPALQEDGKTAYSDLLNNPSGESPKILYPGHPGALIAQH